MNMHKKAKLTPLGRERMVKMMLDGHTPTKAAAVAGVCPGTARKWLVRLPAGMQACSPTRNSTAVGEPAEPRHRSSGSRARLLQTPRRHRQTGHDRYGC